MRDIVGSLIESTKNKRFQTVDIEKEASRMLSKKNLEMNYREFANVINEFCDAGLITPVVSSEKNTMYPPLYLRYTKNVTIDYVKASELVFHPKIEINYYKTNRKAYLKVKDKIEKISEYLYSGDRDELTVNERSYELFLNEKYLMSREGRALLKTLGLTFVDLTCTIANEPFFYFSINGEEVKNILIIENKDTFHSVKKLMGGGITSWGNIDFQFIIYGEGNKITSSIHFLDELKVPDYVEIYYFGDFDVEGISIKNRLGKITQRKIHWFGFFYQQMWGRRAHIKTEKNHYWNRVAIGEFLNSVFDENEQEEIEKYLKDRCYVPQEVINRKRLKEWAD